MVLFSILLLGTLSLELRDVEKIKFERECNLCVNSVMDDQFQKCNNCDQEICINCVQNIKKSVREDPRTSRKSSDLGNGLLRFEVKCPYCVQPMDVVGVEIAEAKAYNDRMEREATEEMIRYIQQQELNNHLQMFHAQMMEMQAMLNFQPFNMLKNHACY